MAAGGAQPAAALGFLTVVDDAERGLIGGYLVLNAQARPLEFHCTVPLKPNRAQQILYGPTLLPYLYGEQIGQALLGKATVRPQVLLTDVPPVLALGDFTDLPLALVAADATAPTALEESSGQVCCGRWRLTVAGGDRAIVANRLAPLAALDLVEPFGRIRAAIEETQRAAIRRAEPAPRLADAA